MSEYSKNYVTAARAARYNQKYRHKIFKRWTTEREIRVIAKLFRSLGAFSLLVDVPCGGGRLFGALKPHAKHLLEIDVSAEQLRFCRQERGNHTTGFLAASALSLPFLDQSVPCVFSARLSHHLPLKEQREKLIAELMRISQEFVVVSFFNTYSLKNWIRRVNLLFRKHMRAKNTLSHGDLQRIAAQCGFRLVRSYPLSRFFSGHHYAVLRRSIAN